MSYNTNDIMGYAQDPIVFSNEQGGNELYEKVKEVMVYGINENGLPATMFEDTIKSGGMFGTKCPLLMNQQKILNITVSSIIKKTETSLKPL